MIVCKNLKVRYKNTGKEAIADISLNIEEEEVVAVLGPSGCGKTTLLSAISGLLGDDEAEMKGTISFDGDVSRISTVFQTPRLLPWRNTMENAIFGIELAGRSAKETKREAGEMLEAVGLAGFEGYFPGELSLGMQQRVNFARAMLTHPALLVLDEPFASLDRDNRKMLREKFLKVIRQKGMTSIFVTHDREEAGLLADRVIVLTAGPARIEGIYSKDEFLKMESNGKE